MLSTTLVLAATAGACRPDDTSVRTSKTAPTAAAAAAIEVVPDFIAAAERARGTEQGRQDARDKLTGGAQGEELWAATYVYAADGDDPAVLAPLLRHDDATIRVLAAGGLVRLGEAAAFTVLVAETGNPATLVGSEPPQAIGEIAALMLAMATGEPFDLDAGPKAQKAWSAWYAAHGDKLKFDAQKGWSTR